MGRIVGLLKSKEELEERIKYFNETKIVDTTFDELLLKKINRQIEEEEFKIKENLEKYHKQNG